MKLLHAQIIASELRERLGPYCERIDVAGSIRRKRPTVKDVELVYISKGEVAPEGQLSMFGEKTSEIIPVVDRGIDVLLREGTLRWDDEVVRRGVKYKRFIHCVSGIVVEMFMATPDNWGLVCALRTGPADFNKRLVTNKYHGGAMPHGMRMEGACLWYFQRALSTPTERDYFELLQVPNWPPVLRTDQKLLAWLKEQPEDKWYPRVAVRRVECQE